MAMKVLTRSGDFTYEDFCVLVKDGQKADLIDGVIYMASPDNTEANSLFVWLICLLSDFLEIKDLGQVFGSRVAARLAQKSAPEPDIAVVKKEHAHRIKKGGIAGAPDLAIEIVSPESVERDYDKKRKLYQRYKMPEYWIIDEDMKKVTLLRLDSKGKYREIRAQKGILHSQVLPGFWVRVEWLWKATRPKKMDALDQILA